MAFLGERLLVAAALDANRPCDIPTLAAMQIDAVLRLSFASPLLQVPVTRKMSEQGDAPALKMLPV